MVNSKAKDQPTPDEATDESDGSVPNQDDQEANDPKASHQPGEAQGPRTDEIEAAEQDPDTAKVTNPVGEATQHESKDPYAEGQHISNPEPDNGGNVDAVEADKAEERTETNQRADDLFDDQQHVKADTRTAEQKNSDKL